MARSTAFSLLTNAEPDDEISDALTDEVRAALPVALADVRRELAPAANRDEAGRVLVEIGKYLRFGGATMTDAGRREFLDGVLDELREYPLSLIVDSIGRSRKRIKGPWEMVQWVVADIEPAVDRLRLEEERIARLAEIAGA